MDDQSFAHIGLQVGRANDPGLLDVVAAYPGDHDRAGCEGQKIFRGRTEIRGEGPILSRVGGVDLPAAGGGPAAFNLAKNRQWEKCRSSLATPAVQQGSVPRKLLFELQRIAIT